MYTIIINITVVVLRNNCSKIKDPSSSFNYGWKCRRNPHPSHPYAITRKIKDLPSVLLTYNWL